MRARRSPGRRPRSTRSRPPRVLSSAAGPRARTRGPPHGRAPGPRRVASVSLLSFKRRKQALARHTSGTERSPRKAHLHRDPRVLERPRDGLHVAVRGGEHRDIGPAHRSARLALGVHYLIARADQAGHPSGDGGKLALVSAREPPANHRRRLELLLALGLENNLVCRDAVTVESAREYRVEIPYQGRA